jgi:hypothetical protein
VPPKENPPAVGAADALLPPKTKPLPVEAAAAAGAGLDEPNAKLPTEGAGADAAVVVAGTGAKAKPPGAGAPDEAGAVPKEKPPDTGGDAFVVDEGKENPDCEITPDVAAGAADELTAPLAAWPSPPARLDSQETHVCAVSSGFRTKQDSHFHPLVAPNKFPQLPVLRWPSHF